MFLTATNLAHYLMARGHLDATSIIDGTFRVTGVGGRNRNFLVQLGNGGGLFVKQPPILDDFEAAYLRREAACYQLAHSGTEPALARLLPRRLDYDTAHHCLVIELLPGSTLTEYLERLDTCPPVLSRLLGEGLAAYHAGSVFELAQQLESPESRIFPRKTPWILRLHQASDAGPVTTGGTTAMVGFLRARPDLSAQIEQLNADWRFDSLIHGDMKWDNCIVLPTQQEDKAQQSDTELRLYFVDWELADISDAAWDVGSLLQAYLLCWILSMEAPTGTDPGQFPAYAQVPLHRLQPAAQALWHAYCQGRGWSDADARSQLQHAFRHAGARLLQSAYEHLMLMPQMTGQGMVMLQTAAGMLHDPDRTAAELLAL